MSYLWNAPQHSRHTFALGQTNQMIYVSASFLSTLAKSSRSPSAHFLAGATRSSTSRASSEAQPQVI